MVFGGVNEDLIQLNEATLWSGGPVDDNVNPKAYEFLGAVRAALRRDDYGRAADLTRRVQGYYTQSYLPLGDLVIQQDTGRGEGKSNSTQYSRDLGLRSGLASTTFSIDGVRYVIAASRVPNTDERLRQELTDAAAKLLPLQIGSKGPCCR